MTTLRAEEIYETAFDDEAFARLPHLLAQVGEARSGLVLWRHHDSAYEVLGYSDFPPEMMGRLPDYLPKDLWARTALDRPNQLLRMDGIIPPDTYEKSVAYNELIRPSGDDTCRCMGMALDTPWGSGFLSVHRARAPGPFQDRAFAAMQASLDHFKKVLRVRGELAAGRRAQALSKSARDSLAVALIRVRSDGRILTANAAAETVLKRADGLRRRNGALTADRPAAAARLADAVARATALEGPAASSILIERGPDLAPYLGTAVPMSTGSGPSVALLLFRDPDAPDDSLVERVRSMFGLTPAEAAIAVELAKGRTVRKLAEARGAAANTLRAQIKSLAGKMGVSRQSEIAALVASLPQIRR